MTAIYEIATLADLLAVPTDKRHECIRQLEYALEMHEFAFGVECRNVEFGPLRWTDDGDRSVTMHDDNGNDLLTLEVTDNPHKPPNA